ncbi:methyltransferase, TIGR00027 family [Frankia torreyi]|uniref:S-adenosyl-L-methionine-dependent methyltransferase n=1 Tax=Frankia torreyi TaxID=1856 RepID=A0A0D8BM96_9ACTN|nr:MULTISPECIES: SAM-dependent methyltransferase [Frankia]KJE25134.1 methyltransferase, TIGR00027 family [Frankia torreyi]KQC37696.1 SAM-dependent methyltransferase [Frankia sp. ACN1ag]
MTFRAASDQIEVPAGVGLTAVGMAWVRARESARRDRLFDDPYAEAFVEAAGGPAAAGPAGAFARFIDVVDSHGVQRTRFFDDYLTRAADDGQRQLVLLAAGLDTRAYRLSWPAGTRLFEVDLPEMLTFKQAVLDTRHATARAERVTVPADLAGDWATALTRAGLRPRERTTWLVEGLLPYLDADQAGRLLTTVGELSAPGSLLGFEYQSADTRLLDELRATPELAEFATLLKGGLDEPALTWLPRHGWQVLRARLRAELATESGRLAPGPLVDGFLVAIRR